MTDEAPKPKRRRWRWIIASVLLLVTCGLRYASRGDARFIGKWAIRTPARASDIDWELGGFRMGTAHVTNKTGRLRMLTFSWTVRHGQLLFTSHNQEKSPIAYLKRYAEIALKGYGVAEAYDILSVTDDEISLRDVESQDVFTLRRIP